jgi:hypothetical protein
MTPQYAAKVIKEATAEVGGVDLEQSCAEVPAICELMGEFQWGPAVRYTGSV